jgi:hypothetical protein
VRIGFDGIANQAGNPRHRSAQTFIVAEDCTLAVNVSRSAKTLGKRRQGQIVAKQFILAKLKRILGQYGHFVLLNPKLPCVDLEWALSLYS